MIARSDAADPVTPGPPTLLGGHRQAVFISDFVHVELSLERATERLFDPGEDWLRAAHRSALRQHFVLTLGQARHSGKSVIVPLLWEPQALERLLPTLEGDLELSDLGTDHCRLSLSGRYRVPLAQIGAVIDKLGMHRVAEASVRRFLCDVAEALETT
jgi:hypothetical protein